MIGKSMPPSPPNLRFSIHSKGLRVEAVGIGTVEVEAKPTCLCVKSIADESRQLRLFAECTMGCRFDCSCEQSYDDQTEFGAGGGFKPYEPDYWFPDLGPSLVSPAHYLPGRIARQLRNLPGLGTTAICQFIGPLRQRIIDHARGLMQKADPNIVAVQKAAFRGCMGAPSIFLDERLYQQPFLVRDLLTYRAAPSVVAAAPIVLWQQDNDDLNNANRNELQELTLDRVGNWLGILSPTKRPYRSLSRTLMSLPGRIPYRLLRTLADIELERPIYDRVVLIALLEAKGHLCNLHFEESACRLASVVLDREPNIRLFMHAQRSDIYAAMQAVGADIRWNLSPRRIDDIAMVARFLMDYPEAHHGKLAGLTRKAIEWHREQTRYEFVDDPGNITLGIKTEAPPIPLPEIPGVTFLSTLREVYREASLMKHCVVNCLASALSGHSFLFHCDYKGHHATVQVAADGRILQANGPYNVPNPAVGFAANRLAQWGSGLRAQRTLGSSA